MPYTVLIGIDGQVIYQKQGEIDPLEVRRLILANLPDDDYIGQQAYWNPNSCGAGVYACRGSPDPMFPLLLHAREAGPLRRPHAVYLRHLPADLAAQPFRLVLRDRARSPL